MPSSYDKDGYQSPPASIEDEKPWGPFVKRKIPLDDFHTCPCCDGKGYVGIVDETVIERNRFGFLP